MVNFRFILLIIVSLFFSCKEKQQVNLKEENTYQIMSFLLRDLRDSVVLIPGFSPPSGEGAYNYTIKDSLKNYLYFYNQTIRKKNIAFRKQVYDSKEDIEIIKECTNDKSLIQSFFETKIKQNIDITKIANSKNDSLFYYNEKHEKMLGKGFQDIDILLSFSNVSFNKGFTKALVTVGVTFEKLNGFSTLIYLEKKHFHWVIKCERRLSIS